MMAKRYPKYIEMVMCILFPFNSQLWPLQNHTDLEER